MYSEIWVDPDEESGNPGSKERGIKLLIKFDLKDVGFFDMMMYYEKGKMDTYLNATAFLFMISSYCDIDRISPFKYLRECSRYLYRLLSLLNSKILKL